MIYRTYYILTFALLIASSAWGSSTEGYFKYSRWCAYEVQRYSFDIEDLTCSTFLPTVILSDVVMIPTFAYLDLVKFLTNPDPSSQSTKGSSDNSHMPATSEKKQPQDEIPEERKIDKNRLSLLHSAADDSVQFLISGETTPLLLATFEQVEQFFVVNDSSVDKHEAYAKALIRLNELIIRHELNLPF